MNNLQIDIIRQYKALKSDLKNEYRIEIKNQDGPIGFLVPIDQKLIENKNIIQSLVKWRNENMRFFLTRFKASEDRTYNWLKDIVLTSDDRILFVIFENEQKAVGNIGLCNITEKSAEIDNVLKGEKTEKNGFMFFAQIALIKWAISNLKIDDIYLNVISDNDNAIRFYSKLGFIKTHIYKLNKVVLDNETRYEVDETSEPDNGEVGLVKMNLNNQEYEKICKKYNY